MGKKYPKVFSPCLKAGTLLVGLMSGYYQRAFAGTCTGAAGVYNCTGAAVPGSDSTVSINIGQPLSVTTLSGFGIDTRGLGGNAFSFYSSGDLTITDTHSSTIAGATNGIVAVNTGIGDLSITTTGTVTGASGMGIWAHNSSASGNSLNISANEVFGGDKGIIARNHGNGDLTVTTSGVVTGANGDGIYANNSSAGTDLIISSVDVTGGRSGIVATNNGSGDLSISTTGSVTGAYGIGVWANNSSNGTSLSISADGISGSDKGIDARNSGSGDLSIMTSGVVSGASREGIYAANSSNGIDLTISAASVTGGSNGIVATNNGSGNLSISATGSVTAANGIGIWANNSVNGNSLSLSAADIIGSDKGIDVRNFGNGNLSISTSGVVTGTNSDGIYAYNSSNGTGLNISVDDVNGEQNGIYAVNLGSGKLSITASGDVVGNTDLGIYAYNSGESGLSISAVNVSGADVGVVALNSGSGPLTIATSGNVQGGLFGIYAGNGGESLSISSSGEVQGGAFGILAKNGGGPLSITSSGLVNGSYVGIYAINYGYDATTINISSSGIVEGGAAGIVLISGYGKSSTINVDGQVRNLSGSPTGFAIIAPGGPTTVNLNVGSQTTGVIGLSGYNDTVRLAGSLNGSIVMGDGNDTFIQVGGSSMSGTADGGDGSDTLGFNNMGVVDGSLLGTKYLSFENLGIYGGSTTLTGTWDFSQGNTTVYAGSLMIDGVLSTRELYVNQGGYMSIPGIVNSSSALVDGSLNLTGSLQTGILSVGPTGFLSGTGVVNGSVVNYGTISPGNSIGTLNVNGSLSFMPGSTYITELAVNGSSDLLRVNGPVTISGGRLQASLPRALYPNGKSWQIISASDGVNGSFSSVNTNFTSSTIRLQQSVYGGTLALVIDRTPYARFGDTANKAAVGSALDTLLPVARGSMASLLTSMDFDMNPAQIRATLQGLNPDMYTVFPAAGIETATIFGQTVSQRQQEIRIHEAFPTEDRNVLDWNVWGRVLGSRLDRSTADEMAGYNLDTGGVVFGVDRSFGPASRAGLLLGYSDGSLDWDVPGNSGQITGKHMGLYGSTNYKGFYLDGLVGYTSLGNNGERLISTPLFSGSAAASFDASTWSGSLTGGYDFAFGSVTLGPVASINYLYLDQDGFSENGTTAFNQKVQASDADSLASNLGLQLGGLIEGGAWRFLPRGSLGWLHQFQDDDVMLNSSFVDYPTASFTMTGVAPVTDQLAFAIGLSAEYGANLSVYADYSITGSGEQTLQFLSCGLSWLF